MELKSHQPGLFGFTADRTGVLEKFRQAGDDLDGCIQNLAILQARGAIRVGEMVVEARRPQGSIRPESVPENRVPAPTFINAPQLRSSGQLSGDRRDAREI